MTSRTPYAGRMEAVGFLIDPEHTGMLEAHRRVAGSWLPGATLRDLAGKLLLVLPDRVSVRAERAPGLPAEGDRATVQLVQDGQPVTYRVDDLPAVDLEQLVDLNGLTVHELAPVPVVPADAPTRSSLPERVPAPAWREVAGIGTTDRRAEKQAGRLRRAAGTATDDEGSGRGRWMPERGRGVAARMLSRRNSRYLTELTRSFQGRDWDTALRNAIGIDGLGGGGISFRLPRRSAVTGPRMRPGSGGGSVPFAADVSQHLREIYREAAAQLEREGDYLRAAFVLADLLQDRTAAVDLLERNGDFRRAAELAEGWDLDPSMAVRLWWRAGDRDRAVRLARARGAFALAVGNLEKVDPEAALSLRREWLEDRRAAGDHLGAVEAGWPDRANRDGLVPEIAAGIAAGGRVSGVLFAFLLEHTTSPDVARAARALLDPDGPEEAASAFVGELAGRPAAAPDQDRELCTAAVLRLLQHPPPTDRRSYRSLVTTLGKRADPLVVADLPALPEPRSSGDGPVVADTRDHGLLEIVDAVAVGAGSILVALGERGARLMTRDGRVRAEWSVPAHGLVVADHGGRALLLADRGGRVVVHEVDLPTGKAHPLPALDCRPLPSYDGARVVTVSERGLEWVEHRDGRWHLVWRELTDRQGVHLVARSATNMAALLTDASGLRVWSWDLPSVTLRQNTAVEPLGDMFVTAVGNLAKLQHQSGVAQLDWYSRWGHRINTATHHSDGPVSLLTAGDAFALVIETDGTRRMEIHDDTTGPPLAVVQLPTSARPVLRSHGSLITVGHDHGRILVVDVELRALVADVRVSS